MPANYPIDLIAKRDKKQKMDRSIVKNWNVHFQTQEEVEEEQRKKREKLEAEKAKEIYDRLSKEQEEDEMQQRAERTAAQMLSEDAYNAKTGSYSGAYGQTPVEDEMAKQQIDAILNEKGDAFSSAMSMLQNQDN